MLKDINDSMVINISEIRRIFNHYKNASQKHLIDNPSDFYRVDRSDAFRYFGIFPKWKDKIVAYFEDLHQSKQKISYVDICGRASGRRFGVQTSYFFSLKTDKISRCLRDKTDVFIDGDLFNAHDFQNFIETVKKRDITPAFVTFMPMAGLHSYTPMNFENMPNYGRSPIFCWVKD